MKYVILQTECESRYVHSIHDTMYISWVEEADIEHAQFFPSKYSQRWIEMVEDMTGVKTVAVEIEQP